MDLPQEFYPDMLFASSALLQKIYEIQEISRSIIKKSYFTVSLECESNQKLF